MTILKNQNQIDNYEKFTKEYLKNNGNNQNFLYQNSTIEQEITNLKKFNLTDIEFETLSETNRLFLNEPYSLSLCLDKICNEKITFDNLLILYRNMFNECNSIYDIFIKEQLSIELFKQYNQELKDLISYSFQHPIFYSKKINYSYILHKLLYLHNFIILKKKYLEKNNLLNKNKIKKKHNLNQIKKEKNRLEEENLKKKNQNNTLEIENEIIKLNEFNLTDFEFKNIFELNNIFDLQFSNTPLSSILNCICNGNLTYQNSIKRIEELTNINIYLDKFLSDNLSAFEYLEYRLTITKFIDPKEIFLQKIEFDLDNKKYPYVVIMFLLSTKKAAILFQQDYQTIVLNKKKK